MIRELTPVPQRSVGVQTSRYVASHGKLPRGSGLWLFELRSGLVVFEHNGPFGAAKKACVAWAASNGQDWLYVCP